MDFGYVQSFSKGVVFIPYKMGEESDLGKVVNDDYFGKVPADRLVINDGMTILQNRW